MITTNTNYYSNCNSWYYIGTEHVIFCELWQNMNLCQLDTHPRRKDFSFKPRILCQTYNYDKKFNMQIQNSVLLCNMAIMVFRCDIFVPANFLVQLVGSCWPTPPHTLYKERTAVTRGRVLLSIFLSQSTQCFNVWVSHSKS